MGRDLHGLAVAGLLIGAHLHDCTGRAAGDVRLLGEVLQGADCLAARLQHAIRLQAMIALEGHDRFVVETAEIAGRSVGAGGIAVAQFVQQGLQLEHIAGPVAAVGFADGAVNAGRGVANAGIVAEQIAQTGA